MIRLGMMARETQTTSIDNVLDLARSLELDAVDVHLSGMSREPAYLQKLKLGCLERGLTIGYLGGGSFVGPPEESEARMEQGRADVDLAAFLGAQLLRVFARHRWPDTESEQEALWGPMIASYQVLSDYAAERGVVVGLQNHNNHSFAMTARQVLRILGEVDGDNFTFIMDTGQWLGAIGSDPRGESDPGVDLYEDYLRPTAPHARYVRAKIYKVDNGREEFLDYDRILSILRQVGYNGTVGMVFELGDRNACGYDEAVRLAATHLRDAIKRSAS
ncbi:sugar phosphate isomerase/epimerase family protein [Candidatus Latescibacterota bacterium]